VELLIDAGANAQVQAKFAWYPIHFAADVDPPLKVNYDVIAALIRGGALTSSKAGGKSLLELASAKGPVSDELVQLLTGKAKPPARLKPVLAPAVAVPAALSAVDENDSVEQQPPSKVGEPDTFPGPLPTVESISAEMAAVAENVGATNDAVAVHVGGADTELQPLPMVETIKLESSETTVTADNVDDHSDKVAVLDNSEQKPGEDLLGNPEVSMVPDTTPETTKIEIPADEPVIEQPPLDADDSPIESAAPPAEVVVLNE